MLEKVFGVKTYKCGNCNHTTTKPIKTVATFGYEQALCPKCGDLTYYIGKIKSK